MFTKLEQRSWTKIEVARSHCTQECFQGLHEACGDAALPHRTVAGWVKMFRKGSDAVQNNLCKGKPHSSTPRFPVGYFLRTVAAGDKSIECATPWIYGPGSLSGKALGYALDGQVSIPDGGGVHFFHYFRSRLVLESTQLPVKWVPGVKMVKRRASHGCEYVDPCIHIPLGPSWSVMGIP